MLGSACLSVPERCFTVHKHCFYVSSEPFSFIRTPAAFAELVFSFHGEFSILVEYHQIGSITFYNLPTLQPVEIGSLLGEHLRNSRERNVLLSRYCQKDRQTLLD